jgi:hypothetical protein
MSFGFFDYVFCDTVKPDDVRAGAIVWTNLFPFGRHSGIVVDRGSSIFPFVSVIKKNSNQCEVSHTNIAGFECNPGIFVACKNGKPIHEDVWAERALQHVGDPIEYHLFKRNCHAFTASCIGCLNVGGSSYAGSGISLAELLADITTDYFSNFNPINEYLTRNYGSIKWLRIDYKSE